MMPAGTRTPEPPENRSTGQWDGRNAAAMIAAQQPDGNLPEARQRLHNAISALIDPRDELANHTTAEVPSLYEQLYDAIPGTRGEHHTAGASVPPIWIDAARLIAWIDSTVRKWQPEYARCQHCKHCASSLPAIRRLETLRAKRWRPQDTPQIHDYATQLENWATEIDMLLTPQPIRALWAAEGGGFAACPACDQTMAKKRDNAGEIVGTPALQLNTDGSTHCQACNTTWGPQHATWVCRILGYPIPAGVLE